MVQYKVQQGVQNKGGDFMLAANYSTVRSNLKDYCDKATDNYETVIVTRKGEKNIVIISLDKYNDLMKAIRNSEYLDKIDKSIEQIEQGKTVTKSIEELKAMENE